MATAKKAAPKAAATPKTTATPMKSVKPAAKAPAPKASAPKAAAKKSAVSKTVQAIARIAANIAKLTERKDKLNAEIQALRDQRAALKAAPTAIATPVPAKARVVPKAPIKAVAKVAVKKK